MGIILNSIYRWDYSHLSVEFMKFKMKKFLLNQAVVAYENYIQSENELCDYDYEFYKLYYGNNSTKYTRARNRFKLISTFCDTLNNWEEGTTYYYARETSKINRKNRKKNPDGTVHYDLVF